MPLNRPDVIVDILEEHLEELDFLWEQRERFVFDPEWTLDDLAELEGRADAHLEGLCVGQGRSADLALGALVGDLGAATAGAMVLLAFEDPELDHALVDALATGAPDTARGVGRALRHGRIGGLEAPLREACVEAPALVRAVLADVFAFHGLTPPTDVQPLLEDEDPVVWDLAMAAAGRQGGPWGEEQLARALGTEVAPLQRRALETSALVALPGLAARCRDELSSSAPVLEAIAFLGVVGEPGDESGLRRAVEDPARAPAALDALGALGLISTVPWLIELLADADRAEAAAAAFTRITGLDGDDGQVAAQEEWAEESDAFSNGSRWQSGHEVSERPLGEAFAALSLEARRDLLLGDRLRVGGATPRLELEARARIQRAFSLVSTLGPER